MKKSNIYCKNTATNFSLCTKVTACGKAFVWCDDGKRSGATHPWIAQQRVGPESVYLHSVCHTRCGSTA